MIFHNLLINYSENFIIGILILPESTPYGITSFVLYSLFQLYSVICKRTSHTTYPCVLCVYVCVCVV